MLVMGWVNYVLIPKYKIAFVVDRGTDELPERLEKSLDDLRNDFPYLDDDKKVSKLTVGDLMNLLRVYDRCIWIAETSVAHFLLYFLKKYRINFEIKSEFDVKEKDLKKKGWIIVDTF